MHCFMQRRKLMPLPTRSKQQRPKRLLRKLSWPRLKQKLSTCNNSRNIACRKVSSKHTSCNVSHASRSRRSRSRRVRLSSNSHKASSWKGHRNSRSTFRTPNSNQHLS